MGSNPGPMPHAELSCPERDLNTQSPAYMADTLPTKLSRLGTNLGTDEQCKPDRTLNSVQSTCTCI